MVGRCFRHRDADIGVNGRRRYFAVWIAAQKPRSAVVATHDRELGRIEISPTIGLYTQTHKKIKSEFSPISIGFGGADTGFSLTVLFSIHNQTAP